MVGVNSKAIKDLVTELTQRTNIKRYDDLIQFTEIYKTIQKLQKLQKKKQDELPLSEREFILFNKWLAGNGYQDKGIVEIAKFENMGYGLKAKKDIKEGELLLDIPKSVMITENSIFKTKLEAIVNKDPMLQNIPSLRLALFLVHEKISNNSFFAPYLILPRKYDLPFYSTLEELCALKGSPLRHECFQMIGVAARQYCHIYKLLQDNPQAQTMTCFSFNISDFFWAVSCVMSRQNQIPNFEKFVNPSSPGRDTVMSLIPLWDFANHAQGHVTTYFDGGSLSAKCTAMQTFKQGEQVNIYYGNRGNRELFAYSGFVVCDYPNAYDVISVSMSPQDVADTPDLTKRKEAIFSALSLPNAMTEDLSGRFVSSDFILYAAILSLSEDDVTKIFGEDAENCKKTKEEVLPILDKQGRKFMSSKIKKWIAAYPTSDEVEANQSVATKNATFIWKLEKRILTETLNLLQSNKELKDITEDPSPPAPSKPIIVEDNSSSSSSSLSANANKKKKKKAKKAKAKEAAAAGTPAASS